MSRASKSLLRAAGLGLALVLGYALRSFLGPRVTVSGLSPNDAWLVSLTEKPMFLDRNFEVHLRGLKTKSERMVFRSPDEGRPPGTERIVWSSDGSRFLILGRKFFSSEKSLSINEESAYLMMDVDSGQIWCNASQQRRYPSFTLEDVRKKAWLGWNPAAN